MASLPSARLDWFRLRFGGLPGTGTRHGCLRNGARAALDEPVVPRLALQYSRFAIVGISATLIYAMAFTAFIELVNLAPLIANFAAFGIALLIILPGPFSLDLSELNRRFGWRQQRTALMRFAAVAQPGSRSTPSPWFLSLTS